MGQGSDMGQRASVKTFYYLDGAANQYTITSDELSYEPVRPEESSTGSYSGGEPYKMRLSADQFEFLATVFGNAAKSEERKEGIPENRGKGTGLLIMPDGSKHIFAMSSAQRRVIEDAIESVAKRKEPSQKR